MQDNPILIELLKEVDAVYTKHCQERGREPLSFCSTPFLYNNPVTNAIFIPVPLLKRIHAELNNIPQCSECGGTGKIDDGDPNGIFFNEIDCGYCRGD